MSANQPNDLRLLSSNLKHVYAAAGEAWSGDLVMKVGRIARPEWNVRGAALPSASPLQRLALNDVVLVERATKARPEDPLSWLYVYARTGSENKVVEGWVRSDGVLLDPPEPEAKVEYVATGDTLIDVAARYYKPPGGFRWGEDARFYVAALGYVNRQSGGLIFPSGWTDADFKERGRWADIGVKANHAIWIPQKKYVDHLKGTFVSSGSITYELWQLVKNLAADLWDGVVGAVAFAAGTIHGALQSVYDMFAGAVELVVMAWKVLRSALTGNLLRDAKQLWDAVRKIDWGQAVADVAEDFANKWTAEDPWARGYFQGRVVGYVVAEVAMAVLSVGVVSALKWVAKSSKFVKPAMTIVDNPVVKTVAHEVEKAAGALDAATKGTLARKIAGKAGRLINTRRVTGKMNDLVFTVAEETLADGTKRTLSIEGKVRKVPERLRHTGGDRTAFDHHGHLIADELGGPSLKESGNIVAMHGIQNHSGEYRKLEKQIVELLGDRDGWMKVSVEYKNPTDWRPHAFEVEVVFSNGMRMRQKIFNFNPHIPNPYK